MSWAARRRFIISLIIGAVIVAFLVTVLIATFYKTPSCTDGVANGDETGIDCGGSCMYLCTEQMQSPTVLFTKAFENGAGRTDIIASVENKNLHSAPKHFPYNITFYGANQLLIQEVTGMLDLPPGATAPIYVSGVTAGKQKVVNAFLDIASSSPRWFTFVPDTRIVPIVSNMTQGGTSDEPRVEATLTNPSVTVLTNVQVVVFVRSENKDIIAASKTIVPFIPAQGQATATFTWNTAFTRSPASIEVVPIIPLP